VKVAGLALGATAILALLERGKIARNYGQLLVDEALGKTITEVRLKALLPKNLDDLFHSLLQAGAWRTHWEYYLARFFFSVGVLAILALALWL
jgi:hypothetical protein